MAIVVVMGIVAVVIPNTRYVLLPWTAAFVCMRFFFTGSRRSRRSREALADRRAAMPRDDIPADVISLVAAGKRIQAIKRYRDVAGVDLKEAETVIDGL
ncbi:MAG TPA: hypothetical protein VH021_03340 [Trebonia sp.]|nr:hypothetical protein [Trebonia sp.]